MEHKNIGLFVLEHLIWIINIAVFSTVTLINPNMLQPRVILSMLHALSPVSLVVLAEGICLITGCFDMSVGSTMGFSALVTAAIITVWFQGIPWYLGILIAIAIGITIGFFNGFFVGYMDINPFLQTLTTNLIFAGLMIFLVHRTIYNIPSEYLFLGRTTFYGIPLALVVIVIVFVLTHFFLNSLPMGRHMYAVGSNREAAIIAGINTKKVITLAFVISGCLCSLGGVLYTGYLASVTMTLGSRSMLKAFTGAIIGGVSLKGGHGKVSGILGGVFLLGILETGLTMIGVSPTVRNVVDGIMLFAAIVTNSTKERLRRKLLME